MRTIMTVVIFAALLPLAVFVHPRKRASSPNKTTLFAAKASVFLMSVGAMMIGLARTVTVLVVGESHPLACRHGAR